MESIILMVILAVGSSLFQAFIKNQKKAQEKEADIQASKPKLKTTVNMTGKPNIFAAAEAPKKDAARTQKPAVKTPVVKAELEAPMRSFQADAVVQDVISDQTKQTESIEAASIIQELTINDLQRSIVLSEILGKPKALQRGTR